MALSSKRSGNNQCCIYTDFLEILLAKRPLFVNLMRFDSPADPINVMDHKSLPLDNWGEAGVLCPWMTSVLHVAGFRKSMNTEL